MMIKQMNDASFAQYGVAEQFHKEPNRALNQIVVSGETEVTMYQFSSATFWDYVDGMTILLIRDGEELKRYYLDRAVTIYPGICFGFYCLGSESTIACDMVIENAADVITVKDTFRDPFQMQQLQVFTLFRQLGRDGLFFRGEQHPPLELAYVEKGVLRNYCNGHEIVLHPNEFIIFAPDQWHMQHSEEEVQFLTISFLWEGQDFSHLYNSVSTASSEIQRSVRMLLEEYEQDLPQREEFLNAQIKLLLLQMLRLPGQGDTNKKPSPASDHAHRRILDQAMQLVSEKIYGKFTVCDLAAAVNVSTSQLTALFKDYLGMTPAKYITHIRLEESKNLLAERKLSIGEIADLLGYASIQHYSKQFRDWFGCTPSAYARR